MIRRSLVVFAVLGLLTACTVSGPATSSPSSSSSQVSSVVLHTLQGPGFHITYDPSIFTLQSPQLKLWYFGGSMKRLTGTSLVRRIAVQHCALSGKCTPATDNPLIGIYVIDEPVAGIRAKAQNWQKGQAITVSGRTGFAFEMGVEGEGERDMFGPLDASHTLYITCSTINESAMSSYANEPTFLKLAQQQELCTKVLSAVTFE